MISDGGKVEKETKNKNEIFPDLQNLFKSHNEGDSFDMAKTWNVCTKLFKEETNLRKHMSVYTRWKKYDFSGEFCDEKLACDNSHLTTHEVVLYWKNINYQIHKTEQNIIFQIF